VPAAMIHKTIVEVVEKNNLLENVKETGVMLLNGLKKIQKKDQRVLNARGMGTYGSSN
jgi:4-aminobutyrate aminotransferase-like enzyme